MSPIVISKNVDTPYPAPQGTDEQKYYAFVYRPKPRENLKAYTDRHDRVAPETDLGLLFACVGSGVSGMAPPVYGTTEGQVFMDGTVAWEVRTDNSLVRFGDTISHSVWTADAGVALAHDGIDQGVAFVQVTAVPANQDSFNLSNQITVTRADAKVEVFGRTVVVPIKQADF